MPLDEAPGGAGDAGRLLGLLGAGIDCQSTKNKGRAKELYAFVLWAHQGGPCHGAASAALYPGYSGGFCSVILASGHQGLAESRRDLLENGSTFLGRKQKE